MNAPVILFAYKRPNELRQTIDALKANYLAPESDLYVFVDAPQNPADVAGLNVAESEAPDCAFPTSRSCLDPLA